MCGRLNHSYHVTGVEGAYILAANQISNTYKLNIPM